MPRKVETRIWNTPNGGLLIQVGRTGLLAYQDAGYFIKVSNPIKIVEFSGKYTELKHI